VSLTATAEAIAAIPSAMAAGETQAPGYTYPDRYTPGTMVYGDEAKDRIAPPGTDARAAFEAELASMDADAPTAERVLLLNTTDPDNLNWTYLPGNEQGLYVAVIREGGAEKIDTSLHDWRVGNVPGVEMVGWQQVTPPPGTDHVRLVANGATTVVGAYQGNKLVYWLSAEANDGMGDWRPNDSNMPEGAEEYTFNDARNSWLTEANGLIYEYQNGDWVEVPQTVIQDSEALANLGVEYQSVTNLDESRQVAWSGAEGTGEPLAIYEPGKSWYSIWNLTVTLDPNWTLDKAVGEDSLAIRRGGELLYRQNNEGNWEMVPSPVQLETMNAYHEAVDFGIVPIDGHEMYEKVIDGLVQGAPEYWRDLGVNPDANSVLSYLRSVDYKVPVESPNGERLKLVQRDNYGRGFIKTLDDPADAVVDLSDTKYIFAGLGVVTQNVGNISTIMNDKEIMHHINKIKMPLYFGLGFYRDQTNALRPVWIFANTYPEATSISEWQDWHLSPINVNALETEGISYSEDYDSRLMTAFFKGYWQFLLRGIDDKYFGIHGEAASIAGAIDVRARTVKSGEEFFRRQ